MRYTLLAASAALLIASPHAIAADAVEVPPEAPVAVETVYDWSGLYIGAFGGYGWGNLDVDDLDTSFDVNGGLAGGHIGYNFVAGAWVFGIESEFGWSGADGNLDATIGGLPIGIEADLNWFGSTTGRVGYAIDRTLLYGKAGVSYGEVEVSGTGVLDGLSESDTNAGWTAGGGVEFGFTENVIGRLEYQYYDFGDFGSDDGIDGADFDMHSVKAAISFKF